jgi:hypothetical protein
VDCIFYYFGLPILFRKEAGRRLDGYVVSIADGDTFTLLTMKTAA